MCRAFLATCILAASCLSSAAADFSAPILGPDGKAVPSCSEQTAECQKPATLGAFASAALFANFPDENDPRSGSAVSPEEKVKRAALAFKVIGGGKIDLTAEETALVKRLVGKAYAPLVVYRVWALVDPASVTKP